MKNQKQMIFLFIFSIFSKEQKFEKKKAVSQNMTDFSKV